MKQNDGWLKTSLFTEKSRITRKFSVYVRSKLALVSWCPTRHNIGNFGGRVSCGMFSDGRAFAPWRLSLCIIDGFFTQMLTSSHCTRENVDTSHQMCAKCPKIHPQPDITNNDLDVNTMWKQGVGQSHIHLSTTQKTHFHLDDLSEQNDIQQGTTILCCFYYTYYYQYYHYNVPWCSRTDLSVHVRGICRGWWKCQKRSE